MRRSQKRGADRRGKTLLRTEAGWRFAPRRCSPYIGRMKSRHISGPGSGSGEVPVVGLRIIGGKLRGRKLQYSGDLRTRPMKDRVREAVFNLLGPGVKGSHAIDLFAGTGALGLEAISRGAAQATLIERHLPTSR